MRLTNYCRHRERLVSNELGRRSQHGIGGRESRAELREVGFLLLVSGVDVYTLRFSRSVLRLQGDVQKFEFVVDGRICRPPERGGLAGGRGEGLRPRPEGMAGHQTAKGTSGDSRMVTVG